MTVLLAGLFMGVASSLHCVAMCGPIVLLASGAPETGATRVGGGWRRLLSRTAWHHTGRVGMYGVLGLAAGGTGQAIDAAGLRGGLAIAIGVTLAVGALASLSGHGTLQPGRRWSRRATALIGAAARRLRRDRWSNRVALGAINSLLPCGLLYAAVLAAAGLGGPNPAVLFMIGFGLGSVPALVALTSIGARVPARPFLRRASPIATAIVGLLLVLRGAGVQGITTGSHGTTVHHHLTSPDAGAHK